MDLNPGIYRLMKDLPAIAPDKRQRHDWRAAPMRAGTLFAVRDERYLRDAYTPLLVLTELHGYAHLCVSLSSDLAAVPALIANLKPVTKPTATEYLAFLGQATAAGDLLDMLLERGLLTTCGIDWLLAERDVMHQKSSGEDP